MDHFTIDHIKRLCFEVELFSKRADWRWKALPVISWEFATISEYARARAELLQSLTPEVFCSKPGVERVIGSDRSEIDCYGVTFRLICKERIMTEKGEYGAAELKYEKQP